MSTPKQYKVYSKITGALLAQGTARQCSEVLRVGGDTIRAIGGGKYKSRLYLVEEQEQEPQYQELNGNSDIAAAKKWDAFREPICKKYGIPVRHLEEGKK